MADRELVNGGAHSVERGLPFELASRRAAPELDERELVADMVTALRSELSRERERRRRVEIELLAREAQLERLHRRIERDGETPAVSPAPAARLVALARDRPDDGVSYWLRRCEGFQVDAGDDPVGIVESIRFGRRHDHPDELLVTTSGWRRELLAVSTESVIAIWPEERQVVLAADPRRGSAGIRRRLRGR
jgi:hypothetical protein